jgi:type IV secretory pathway TraG/TraD family ATPase VirD4
MLVAQSLSQLKQVYGERSSILDNTHVRVLFRPETIETAEYISKTLGQTTVRYKTTSEGGKKGSPFFSNINEALHVGSRPLLTPREVMELPDDEALVMVGGGKPIRASKIRYFDDGSFTPLLAPPPIGTAAGVSDKSAEWLTTCYEGSAEHVAHDGRVSPIHVEQETVPDREEASPPRLLQHPYRMPVETEAAPSGQESESTYTVEDLA